MNIESIVRSYAEVAGVIGTTLGEKRVYLGNEGMILHYSLIADCAIAFMKQYPDDYDWETHMDDGGDCWDIEADSFLESWLENNNVSIRSNDE